MRLLIDGYNLLHNAPELFPAQDRGRGRDALLLALKLYRDKKAHQLTVVFDGGEEPEPRRGSLHGVPVVFAGGKQSADQVIVEMLSGGKGAGVTVITDDRELAGLCRQQGAQVIESRVFAARLMETAQGWAPLDDEDEGWNFSTKKKGPSHRSPKARRRREQTLGKI